MHFLKRKDFPNALISFFGLSTYPGRPRPIESFLVLRKFHFYLWMQWQEISCSIVERDQNVGKEKQKPPHFWLGELSGAEEKQKWDLSVQSYVSWPLCPSQIFAYRVIYVIYGKKPQQGNLCSQFSSFGIQERDDNSEDPHTNTQPLSIMREAGHVVRQSHLG